MPWRVPRATGVGRARMRTPHAPGKGTPMDSIRILIADDHPVFRYGLRALLNAEPELEVVGEAGEETVQAIRVVSKGEAIFSPAIAQRLIQYFGVPRPATPPQAFPALTEREREILSLIAQGYTNTAIAERLVLSPKTVRNHVSNIFSKLQVADRARDAGLK